MKEKIHEAIGETGITLGSEVEETISGFRGIVFQVEEHFSGCPRVGIRAQEGDDPTEKFYDIYELEKVSDGLESEFENVEHLDIKTGNRVRDRISGMEGIVTIVMHSAHGKNMVKIRKEDEQEVKTKTFYYGNVEKVGDGIISQAKERMETMKQSGCDDEGGVEASDVSVDSTDKTI